MNFDYFYNRDGDRFSFFMLSKVLVTDEAFKGLSTDAKILYSCLLERTNLSYKNKWIDDEERVYIIFTVGESKSLAISKWELEFANLKKDKKKLYNQILEIREEVGQAEKVKTCIEQLQGQEKRLSQVKRNELDL